MRGALFVVVAMLGVDPALARIDRPALRSRVRTNNDATPVSTLHQLRGGAVATPAGTSSSLIGMVLTQLAYEVSSAGTHPAKLFGFMGACCNWFLGLSAVYDATRMGPEVISLPMTLAMLAYSILFSRWGVLPGLDPRTTGFSPLAATCIVPLTQRSWDRDPPSQRAGT